MAKRTLILLILIGLFSCKGKKEEKEEPKTGDTGCKLVERTVSWEYKRKGVYGFRVYNNIEDDTIQRVGPVNTISLLFDKRDIQITPCIVLLI